MRRRNQGYGGAVADMVNLRDEFASQMTGFRSGYESRFGVSARGGVMGLDGGADARLTATEYYKVIEDSRIAHEKFSFVRGLTRQARTHRVQDGYTFDAQTEHPDCNKFLNDYMAAWLDDPERFDVNGELNWPEAQKATEDAVIRDGDLWWLGLADGRVQLIEGHRVRSSNWARGTAAKGRTDGTTEHLGVLCAAPLRRLAIRVTKTESRGSFAPVKLDDLTLYQVRDFHGVRQVFHVHDADRISLTRGLSAWATTLESTNMLDQGKFALLVKTVLAASLAWVATTKGGAGKLQIGEKDDALGAVLKQPIENVNAGGVVNLEDGETLELLGATIGASEAIQLCDLITQDLSLNLGLPLAIGILNGDKLGNFTSGRMTWDIAKIGIKATHQTRKKQLALPMWDWKLHWLLRQPDSDKDAVRARKYFKEVSAGEYGPKAFFWVRCLARGYPYPQPLDDASANALSVSTYQNSLRRIQAERGGVDFPTLSDEIADDRETVLTSHLKAFERVKKLPAAQLLGDFSFKDFLELGLFRAEAMPREKPEASATASQRDQKSGAKKDGETT